LGGQDASFYRIVPQEVRCIEYNLAASSHNDPTLPITVVIFEFCLLKFYFRSIETLDYGEVTTEVVLKAGYIEVELLNLRGECWGFEGEDHT
jgi:hypothetical protein